MRVVREFITCAVALLGLLCVMLGISAVCSQVFVLQVHLLHLSLHFLCSRIVQSFSKTERSYAESNMYKGNFGLQEERQPAAVRPLEKLDEVKSRKERIAQK